MLQVFIQSLQKPLPEYRSKLQVLEELGVIDVTVNWSWFWLPVVLLRVFKLLRKLRRCKRHPKRYFFNRLSVVHAWWKNDFVTFWKQFSNEQHVYFSLTFTCSTGDIHTRKGGGQDLVWTHSIPHSRYIATVSETCCVSLITNFFTQHLQKQLFFFFPCLCLFLKGKKKLPVMTTKCRTMDSQPNCHPG